DPLPARLSAQRFRVCGYRGVPGAHFRDGQAAGAQDGAGNGDDRGAATRRAPAPPDGERGEVAAAGRQPAALSGGAPAGVNFVSHIAKGKGGEIMKEIKKEWKKP